MALCVYLGTFSTHSEDPQEFCKIMIKTLLKLTNYKAACVFYLQSTIRGSRSISVSSDMFYTFISTKILPLNKSPMADIQ